MTYFRRSGPLEERRRRLLSDSLLAAALGLGSRPVRLRRPGRRRVRLLRSANYGDGRFLDELPRLIDLIPLRAWSMAAVFVAGLLAVAALLALHAWAPRMAAWAPSGRPVAFDLNDPQGLARWFSTLVLACAALAAVTVYSIRRYKLDDYHGHYHIWLWAALCWLYMSAEQSTCLRQTLADVLVVLTGTPLVGDGSVWWIVLYGFLIGGVAARLVVDMRGCLISSLALLGAAVCYGVVLLAHFQMLTGFYSGDPLVLRHGAVLVGNYLIFMAMLLHGRYVLFDALGLFEHQTPAQALRQTAELAQAAELLSEYAPGVRIHPAHGTRGTRSSNLAEGPQQVTVVVAPQAADAPTAPPPAPLPLLPAVVRRLTRAERRRGRLLG